ncbi:hypothetical protein [Pseudomonas putida]|uniref:Uncharacterized protein n=1 Tax=Pseudomonas putida TaxID=303 RepID=A0A8I1EBK4_PSEPU|nr:hypothetical protein [Pseudomonas putida]MBI6882785.1 hypothetical protein [Pseudomonas putida]
MSTSILEEIKAIRNTQDANHFVNTCNNAKLEVLRLLEANEYSDALTLNKELGDVFWKMKNKTVGFMLQAISVFPKNKHSALSHLGISSELDKIIFDTKFDLGSIKYNERGLIDVFSWAVVKQDLQLMEDILSLVSLGDKSRSNWIETGTWSGYLNCFNLGAEHKTVYPEKIDILLSRIVTRGNDYCLRSCDLPAISKMGLQKTIMSLLSHGLVEYFKFGLFSKDDIDAVQSIIPENLSPEQTSWVLHGIHVPGLTEKILSDSSFDIEAFVSYLKTGKASRREQIKTHTLEIFKDVLNPEHLTSGIRRRRAAMLIDAAIEEERDAILYKSDEDSLKKLVQRGFDPYIMKIASCTKSKQLEDELGM